MNLKSDVHQNYMPSALRYCWLCDKKGIRPVKNSASHYHKRPKAHILKLLGTQANLE